MVCTLHTNFLSLEQEQYQSMDEQMVAAKTKRSGICQYLSKKIHRWIFKNFARAGASGIIYNFFFYTGQTSARREKCGVSEVVLRLVEELLKNQNFLLFMDNCFSTLPLRSDLKTMEILSIVTFCSNRLGGCPLMCKKDMKTCCRGLFDYWMDYNTGPHLLRWFDNKCLVVGSSFAGVEYTNKVERYDLAQRKKVKINCPDMVSQYNQSGGWGWFDWYADCPLQNQYHHIKKMVPHTHLPLCWYSKSQCLAPLSQALSTKRSLKKIADELENLHNTNYFCITLAATDTKKTVNQPRHSISPKPPVANTQFEKVAHWPEIDRNRSCCQKCNMACTVKCSKCKVGLCFNKKRNCLKDFYN